MADIGLSFNDDCGWVTVRMNVEGEEVDHRFFFVDGTNSYLAWKNSNPPKGEIIAGEKDFLAKYLKARCEQEAE